MFLNDPGCISLEILDPTNFAHQINALELELKMRELMLRQAELQKRLMRLILN